MTQEVQSSAGRPLEATYLFPLPQGATVDEFALLQRHYPIVFSVGDQPVPLALMGLNEGVNVFFEDGQLIDRSVARPRGC